MSVPVDAAVAPHLSLSTPSRDSPAPPLAPEFARQGKLWRPRRVLITPNAWALPHGRAMLDRAAGYGAAVTRLGNNRLPPITAETDQKRYALAKTTFAIVVSPPGQRKLQPIPPRPTGSFTSRRAARHTASTAILLGHSQVLLSHAPMPTCQRYLKACGPTPAKGR